MKIQLVISRYQENLDWIHEYSIPTIVYNKGLGDFERNHDTTIINLPNIGREGHTYLHHIIMNYDNLADVTIFFPGSLNKTPNKYGNTYKYNKSKTVMKYALQGKGVIMGVKINNLPKLMHNFTLDEWGCTDEANIQGSCSKTEPATIRPFGNWYTHFFGITPCEYFVSGGVFAIHKSDIIKHSIAYYIRLIQELQTHNPEAGHYLERSWEAVFTPKQAFYLPYLY